MVSASQLFTTYRRPHHKPLIIAKTRGSQYALVLFTLGSLTYVTFKYEPSRYHQASLIFGLCLLLLGLTWMKDSMSFLGAQVNEVWFRDYPLVIYFIGGIVFTALVQSSSAIMVIILSAAHADIIPLSNAAAIAIGSDLGTTGTVLLGSLKSSTNAKRVALSHFIVNLGTDVSAFLLLTPPAGVYYHNARHRRHHVCTGVFPLAV